MGYLSSGEVRKIAAEYKLMITLTLELFSTMAKHSEPWSIKNGGTTKNVHFKLNPSPEIRLKMSEAFVDKLASEEVTKLKKLMERMFRWFLCLC